MSTLKWNKAANSLLTSSKVEQGTMHVSVTKVIEMKTETPVD